MLADGGRCVSDLAALAGPPALFGEVASVSTARRVVLSVGERELSPSVPLGARARVWTAGASAERVILESARITASRQRRDRREQVGADGEVAGARQALRVLMDVVVEADGLVEDDEPGPRPGPHGRDGEMGAKSGS